MKKLVSLGLVTLAIVGLVAVLRYHPASKSDSNLATSSPTPATPSEATPAVVASGATYKDGHYTGSTIDVGYGPVQVQAIISGGKISDIKFLQMPSSGHDAEVTAAAEPILRSETLQAQSANVDIASGATQTSQGYIQSLQNALNQAKA